MERTIKQIKNAKSLRKKYPRFIYQRYSYALKGKELRMAFRFKIESSNAAPQTNQDIRFKARIAVKNVSSAALKKIGERALNNFVFHLGLMEIPSYWKTVCSPEIMIRAGFLTKEQANWWKDLIMNGMGQFFYENKINFIEKNFLKIVSNPSITAPPLGISALDLKDKYLIPIGGGKDSIVTLEKTKKRGKQLNCFLLNPGNPQKRIVKIAGVKKPIVAERIIDPALIKLNREGFLNGHTPFTAVLHFLSVFCGTLFDCKTIAFSNEGSADEENITYLGKPINHQYSKTSDFEKKFRWYCRKYLAKKSRCFSFLRKHTELEVSKMFTKYPQYFSVFSSCNAGFKTRERWCANCPKCLFVYLTLYPHLEKKQLLKIFGKDIFDPSAGSEQKKILSIMEDLLGRGRHKPFECVGTYKESAKAFNLSLAKAKREDRLPYLLRQYNETK